MTISSSRKAFGLLVFSEGLARLFSQPTTGAIRGVVTDPTGAVVSHVTVMATNDLTRITQTTKTGAGSPGTGGHADRVPGIRQTTEGPVSARLDRFLNAAPFSPAPRSRFGNLGRNTVRGPGAHLWDTRLSKLTPYGVLDTAAFGAIRSTLSNARIIQFGLRLEF